MDTNERDKSEPFLFSKEDEENKRFFSQTEVVKTEESSAKAEKIKEAQKLRKPSKPDGGVNIKNSLL